MDAKEFIHQTVTEHPVVLFMKGTAQFPQCGFSGKAIQVLKNAGIKQLVTINVLEDAEVRQAVKDYSNWPTIPQLYINGEFIGGVDIMAEMAESGELQKLIPEGTEKSPEGSPAPAGFPLPSCASSRLPSRPSFYGGDQASPVASSRPRWMFMACTAAPLAPLPRLSMRATSMH